MKTFLLMVLLIGVSALSAAENGFVRTRGTEFVDANGQVLKLRGINLGNWLLAEGYMFHFQRTASPRQIEDVFAELVGDVTAAEFWAEWRENYIVHDDLRLIREMGFNSVRVPLNWRLFVSEHAPFRMEGPGWRLLDRVIEWCRAEKLYAVIDLHGAPGGQTGANIDDSRGRPLLFDDPAAQRLTIELWRAIAERYRDERWVLGYDLLNEPIAHYHDTARLNPKLGEFYRRL
ncbi:MAG TPA: cellulase family glycosylhydrolase, partial [Opitutus sp.]|nr:cellulase family glycosylhydrolase [Opitutus sp.]